MKKKLLVTKKFVKQKKKYPDLIPQLTKQINLFLADTDHPSLNTEKLKPAHYERWSFRVNKKFRVLFSYQDGIPILLCITNHYES